MLLHFARDYRLVLKFRCGELWQKQLTGIFSPESTDLTWHLKSLGEVVPHCEEIFFFELNWVYNMLRTHLYMVIQGKISNKYICLCCSLCSLQANTQLPVTFEISMRASCWQMSWMHEQSSGGFFPSR